MLICYDKKGDATQSIHCYLEIASKDLYADEVVHL